MGRQIEDAVASNAQQIARQFANERIPSSAQNSGILLSPIPVDVDVTVEVYTRPINDTAIGGHPDASQGWGRGSWGDQRGSWTSQESTTTTLNRAGQEAIADALVDQVTEIAQASAGDDVVTAWGIDDSDSETRGRASLRFDESPDTVSTADLRTQDGRVIADGSVTVAVDDQTEARVDVTLTFTAAERTDSERITNLSTIAGAIRAADEDLRLAKIAVGTDDTKPTSSDTSLGSEEVRRQAATSRSGLSAIAQTQIFSGEPTGASFPIDLFELGVFDPNGDLVLRVVFAGETKRERVKLRARSGIRLR